MTQTFLEQWSQHKDQPAVLCSVIEWQGSVPRKDYPMMLVLADGSIQGTIGGGSMELKVIQSAVELMDQTNPRLFYFDLTGKDVQADVGLCGGTLKVLVEQFTGELQEFYTAMFEQLARNRKVMVQVAIAGSDKVRVTRKLITNRNDLSESDPDLLNKLQRVFENQQTRTFEHSGQRYLVWQPFTPPVIHIFGAGHVGQSVATLAHFNDLQVKVYDDRQALMTPVRFPYAQRVSLSFPVIWEDVPEIPEQDFVLIASREHKHDRELLLGILEHPPAYVGLVSSARKWKILSASLAKEAISSASIARVKAPVGLNINAQTVPEIAISIMSEIIRVYRGADQ